MYESRGSFKMKFRNPGSASGSEGCLQKEHLHVGRLLFIWVWGWPTNAHHQSAEQISFYLPTTQMKGKHVCVPGGGINMYFENYYLHIIIVAIIRYTRQSHTLTLISHTPHMYCQDVVSFIVQSSCVFGFLMIVLSNLLFVGMNQ